MIIKLTFLKEVSHILNKSLRLFQTDDPMVPFLCEAYYDLLKLMKMFIPRSTVDNLETPYSLQKFCITSKDAHFPLKQMRWPTALGDQDDKLRKVPSYF